jgi:hypothetical protein
VIALIQEVSPFCKSAALQAAEKLMALKGHGFSRAANAQNQRGL